MLNLTFTKRKGLVQNQNITSLPKSTTWIQSKISSKQMKSDPNPKWIINLLNSYILKIGTFSIPLSFCNFGSHGCQISSETGLRGPRTWYLFIIQNKVEWHLENGCFFKKEILAVFQKLSRKSWLTKAEGKKVSRTFMNILSKHHWTCEVQMSN